MYSGKILHKQSEKFNRETVIIKMPNRSSSVEEYNEWNEKFNRNQQRINKAEEKNDVEDKTFEKIQSEDNKEMRTKSWNEIWDTI